VYRTDVAAADKCIVCIAGVAASPSGPVEPGKLGNACRRLSGARTTTGYRPHIVVVEDEAE
jgi:hypothetical protein